MAHSGTFSLYIDGIKRCDRLCAELWQAIQKDPEYADQTTMFILPDFGRDSDIDSGGNGFQHHRTGDPMSRTTWMMVLGPGIRQNVVVDRPVDSTDLIPTLGSLLGIRRALFAGQAGGGGGVAMLPNQLAPESFRGYPPEARRLATSHDRVAAASAARLRSAVAARS